MITKKDFRGFLTLLLGICIFGACNCATEPQENVTADTTAVVLVEETAVAEPVAAEEIFIQAEQAPMFPGGEDARLKFISSNIKYPTEARKGNIEGTVYIEFVVNKDGKISDAKVVKGIGGGCDEEALKVVNMFPNWEPGRQNGKNVKVLFRMPIKFTLSA